jgi:hypothetical protein
LAVQGAWRLRLGTVCISSRDLAPIGDIRETAMLEAINYPIGLE